MAHLHSFVQHIPMLPVTWSMKFLLLMAALLLSGAAHAQALSVEVRGVEGSLLTNAQTSVENLAVPEGTTLTQRRMARLREEAEGRVARALRPFGYYHAEVSSSIENSESDQGPSTLVVSVSKGPPVRVSEANITVMGSGADLPEIADWHRNWPLPAGARLNHGKWERAKQEAINTLEYDGFIEAQFTEHLIELDLEENTARLTLTLETGPRAIIGEVRFEQNTVRPELLESLKRFDADQYYDGWLVDRLRYDLWKTGYYETIDVTEDRQLDQDPPVVNLNAKLEPRNRDTWQGSVGVGSDTELRGQVNWTRHWLSERGDSLGMGVGWQQRDNRYLLRTNYRLPRLTERRSYWIGEGLYREEDQDLEVSPGDNPNEVFKLTSGNLEHYLLKGGMLNLRDLSNGYQQLTETWFVQYLRENVNYQVPETLSVPAVEGEPGEVSRLFSDDNSSISVGVEWDLPVINGNGFETVGHHERLRLFTAQEAWGSQRSFSQAYFSTRWNFMASERIKILLRGEVGYSDAKVETIDVETTEGVIQISLTELPNYYRFEAGGSQSVRGYAYESLSNNAIGSNNILTFSAETEVKILENWSLAAFYDIGNAFNDWSETDLKQGAGVGVRWYTIAGAVRLDLASALDLPGDPWRIHFTLGVPLL